MLVLSVFYFIVVKYNIWIASVLFGLSVHMRIYPLIYVFGLLLFIYHSSNKLKHVFYFSILSFCVFMALNIISYYYSFQSDGVTNKYLEEAWLYHLTRVDTQHNYSIYFYLLRMNSLSASANANSCYVWNVPWLVFFQQCVAFWLSRFAFVPQFAIILAISFRYYSSLHLVIFLTTFAFVTYNKVLQFNCVCTAQYFNWYIAILPLILPFTCTEKIDWTKIFSQFCSDWKLRRWLIGFFVCIIMWFSCNGHWLFWAYRYEILKKHDELVNVWFASIAFFIVNNILMLGLLLCFRSDNLQHFPKVNDQKKKA
ncbi:hypothetical protein RFI_24404 [Reticulomyxa filosa]|uniref:GPI mannosyltransferase 1 n=1 Tax=Reticulomyxa filosa TaxID=46433 RepID=X6MG33_RETFI|nr:hypothetical protein RFI_24404 [Reticulomyxa filosa]|eukprot:ETO12968.1 hypothetical protein RFI_24404 [Reticulomyxa filosa]